MEYAPQPPIITGIKGRCPRCGEGHLFRPGTFLKIAAKCEVCGLNYSFADPADGPAFFSMMVMAFPATGFCALARHEIRAAGLGASTNEPAGSADFVRSAAG